MSEQRRGLGDAYVLAFPQNMPVQVLVVTTDHPQQYYLPPSEADDP